MKRAGQISATTFEIIIIIAILILVNILGQYYYSRSDLTRDRDFTLADSSKEVVSTLPDIVRITVYVSADLPPVLQNFNQRLRDLLDEYRANGSSRLTIQYVRPEDMSEDEINSINALGIVEQPVQIYEAEQQTNLFVYMGMEISHLDKTEAIPFVPMVSNLEYEITSAIVKLLTDKMPTIGFLVGHGEMTTQTNYTQLKTLLDELYITQDVDLSNGQRIAENVDTLIVANPTETFTERHHYVIDQFVMRGGKLVVLRSGVEYDQMSNQANFSTNPLESLLSSYGIKINNDLVADLDYNWPIPVRNMGPITITEPFPLLPKIVDPDGFPSPSPATRGLENMIFPLVSSLSLLYDRIPEETEIFELARSSANSYSYPAPVNLDWQQDFTPPGGKDDLKYQLVAVQLNGVFESAFSGQSIPALDIDPDAGDNAIPEMDPDPMLSTSAPTSIVVIGNATFVDDNSLAAPGNGIFFQNLMETLNLGESLIDIRTREVSSSPLNPELTISAMNALKFWGYIAVPVIITIFGVARFYLKVQRKRLMQAMYEAEQKRKA